MNKKSQALESELRSLETTAMDQTRYLQLAESLDGFRVKLRARAKTLDVCERQQILRLLVKEILVDANSLTIRHSIPIPQIGSGSNHTWPPHSTPSGNSQKPNYLLRSGSRHTTLRCTAVWLNSCAIFLYHRRFYPQSNGKIELWHKSLKQECIRPLTPLTLEDARRSIQTYVDHNTVRLHSAIGYVTPQDRLVGRQAEIHAARDRKLEEARRQRQRRRQQTASSMFAHSSITATITAPGETEAGTAGRQPC